MRFITLVHLNERSADGRVYSAMEGTTSVFADDDENFCAMARRWAREGKVQMMAEPRKTEAPARGAAKSKEDTK